MQSRDVWARRVKRRLERAGFKVKLVDPSSAMEMKKAGRRKDLELLASAQATPNQIQRKNSVFRGLAKRFRIVDYGGLNKAT